MLLCFLHVLNLLSIIDYCSGLHKVIPEACRQLPSQTNIYHLMYPFFCLPCEEGALLDLLFTNREGLVGDVVVRGSLELSDHEMIEYSVRGEVKRGASKTTTLDSQRADFDLFRMLVERVPRERVLKGKGV